GGGPGVARRRQLSAGGRRAPGAAAQARGAPDRDPVGSRPRGADTRHADRQEVRRWAHPLRVSGGHRPDRVRRALGARDRKSSLPRAGVGVGGAGRREMRIMRRGVVTAVALVLATAFGAGTVAADNNPNGTSFRAVGWFKGKAEITDTEIKCEIPT